MDKLFVLYGVGVRSEQFFCTNDNESVRCKEQCKDCDWVENERE